MTVFRLLYIYIFRIECNRWNQVDKLKQFKWWYINKPHLSCREIVSEKTEIISTLEHNYLFRLSWKLHKSIEKTNFYNNKNPNYGSKKH